MTYVEVDATLPNVLAMIGVILDKVEAPDWHGYSLNALYDSLVVGNINAADPPFKFRIINRAAALPEHEDFLNGLEQVLEVAAASHPESSLEIS